MDTNTRTALNAYRQQIAAGATEDHAQDAAIVAGDLSERQIDNFIDLVMNEQEHRNDQRREARFA